MSVVDGVEVPRREIPTLDVTIDINRAEEEAHKVLYQVRRRWKKEDIKIKSQGVGFLNLVLTAYVGDHSDAVILRTYTGRMPTLCDKKREECIVRLVHEIRLHPEVHCFYNNGCCYEFVQGQNFSWTEFSEFEDIKITKACFRELAKLHCSRTRDLAVNKFNISTQDIMSDFIQRILTFYPTKIIIDDPGAQEIFETMEPTKEQLESETITVCEMVKGLDLDLCLCHGDANPTNYVYNEETDRATIVDFDLGGFGLAEYDLSVFLLMINEGVVRSSPESARRQPRYWKDSLREYLCARSELDGTGPVTDEDVERLYAIVLKLTLYHSLVYMSFAIFDAGMELMPFGTPTMFLKVCSDFYKSYYLKKRDELLALPVPEKRK